MPAKYVCLAPCKKTFITEGRLRQHYQNLPACKRRWEAYHKTDDKLDAIIREQRILRNPTQLADDSGLPRFSEEQENWDVGDDCHPKGQPGANSNMQTGSSSMGERSDMDIHVDKEADADIDMFPIDFEDLFEDAIDVGAGGDIGSVPFEGDHLLPNHPIDLVQDLPLEEDYNPYGDAHDTDEHENEEMDDFQPPEFDNLEPLSVPETIEMSADEDDDADPSCIDVFPRAGEVIEKGQSRYAEIIRHCMESTTRSVYHPFQDFEEFDLAIWLNELPLSKVDSFLQLPWVRESHRPSFGTGKTMRKRLGQLLKPRMSWKHTEIKPRSGKTTSPVFLCYRDPLDAVQSLIDRPSLAAHLTYTPERHWRDKDTGTRLYSEIFTGDWAWETQATLPQGSTLLPVLLGSDKTHLTQHSGDKSAWPLYLSLGNIHSSVRNKPSFACWILISYIPIPVFTDKNPKNHGALQQRLFHQCVRLILSSIKAAGEEGVLLRDSYGNGRRCYPRIAAYLADYPEQLLINCAAGLNSPVTTAAFEDLGNATPSPRRTKEWILGRIAQVCRKVNPDNVTAYRIQAKELDLNAVDQPFWADLPGYEPDLVACPDILHGLFRFWRDHILRWIRNLVEVAELDTRLRVIQPLIGIRHFDGINHLSQWTGRDDRELQRVILPVIAGFPSMEQRVMRCLQSFHDFLYLAQYRSHSTTTLDYLDQSLRVFHSLKRIFIINGARRGKKKKSYIRHFCIPKLAGLHAYSYHIPRMGTSIQFSTEITETCHQTMAKAPYRASNGRDFFAQMCVFMDRVAQIELTGEVATWFFDTLSTTGTQPVNMVVMRDYVTYLTRLVVEEEKKERIRVVQQARGRSDYIWLSEKPDIRSVPFDEIAGAYCLPSLQDAIHLLLSTVDGFPDISPLSLKYTAWFKCRVQRKTVQDEELLADSQTIQARPPRPPTGPITVHGLCNCALIRDEEDAEEIGIQGYSVGQVRLIFRMNLPKSHPLHKIPLVYVYWFTKPRRPESDLKMYQVEYQRTNGHLRLGGIVLLSSIRRLVQLIPIYGPRIDPALTMENSMDEAHSYYINSFLDKETYQSVW